MTIETKFNIGDLVQHKFQRKGLSGKVAVAYEIMEVKAVACYTTAQVFYEARPIHAIINSDYKDGKRVFTVDDMVPGVTKEGEYCKFREDELKVCDSEVEKEVRNEIPLNNQSK